MSKVQGRRTLRFASMDEMLQEAGRIADADRTGRLQRLGNWSAGQCMHHIATWMDYPFDGYPMKIPLFIRVIGPLLKSFVTNNSMPTNRRLPGVPSGTYAVEDVPTSQALPHLERSATRMASTCPDRRNPMFGKLTHEQWIKLNLRHAELHFSFLIPQ